MVCNMAPLFEHDNTAFKYGGYGFWSNRDFFTYYDKKQDEWEVYHPDTIKIDPSRQLIPILSKTADDFHVFGGSTVNPNNRREQLKIMKSGPLILENYMAFSGKT